MKKEKKIQDKDWVYASLLGYVNTMFHHAYSKVEVMGMEKIPKDAAVIYAPNHTNGLMDALAVLALDNQRKVFVARADIFKNPFQAKCLRFLKIMPIMRVRDGLDEVRKNDETMEKSIDVLKDRVPFCILPEGRHRAKHSLMPLCKGIFRIALGAEEELQNHDLPLYIVPVGIEYGNFFRFRSSILIQIGDPIDVRQYTVGHEEMTRPQVMNEMRDDLTEGLKKVTLAIPDDDLYDATFEICAAVSDWQIRRCVREDKKKGFKPLKAIFDADKQTIAEIQKARAEKPEQMQKIFDLAGQARQLRFEKKISLNSIVAEKKFPYRLWKLLLLVVTLPFTVPSVVLSLPVTGICKLMLKNMKDASFHNSFRFAVNLILWPIFWLIYAIVGFCLFPWQLVLPIIIALLPATMISQDVYKSIRLLLSDIRYKRNPELRNLYNQIRKYYHEII